MQHYSRVSVEFFPIIILFSSFFGPYDVILSIKQKFPKRAKFKTKEKSSIKVFFITHQIFELFYYNTRLGVVPEKLEVIAAVRDFFKI